jgi:hypothetical protein
MNTQPRAQTGDQNNMLPATLLVRFSAIAVDLCITATACTLGFALLSFATPADSAAAKAPIVLILAAGCIYFGWGRNRFASIGRTLFKLQVVHVTGLSGLPGRMVTVQTEGRAVYGGRVMSIALGVMVSCAMLTVLALLQVLGSTTVFSTLKRHAQSSPPFAEQYRSAPVLASIPNSLLIGERRAYVQIAATWGEHAGLLDYYLIRREGRWRVDAVHQASEPLLARYTLKTRDEDIPQAPR